MSWKEFLKPSKMKIIIVAFIFLFYNILGYLGYANGKFYNIIFIIFGLPLFVLEKLIPLTSVNINPLITFSLATITWLPYLYLVSCLIVWIYNKVKKK